MDPVTALTIGSLFLGTVGTIASSRAQKRAGEAEQAAFNMRATAVERKGVQEEQVSRDRLRKLLSTQRAMFAKAGVDIGSGSPLTVLAATAAEGEEEALNIRLGAEEEAGFQRFSGAQARATGRRKASSTLLTGLGSTGLAAASAFKPAAKPTVVAA